MRFCLNTLLALSAIKQIIRRNLGFELTFFLLLHGFAFNSASANSDNKRELESILIRDNIAEALHQCTEKMPLDQKFVVWCNKRTMKSNKHHAARTQVVKDKAMSMKESQEFKDDPQYMSTVIPAISASGMSRSVKKRKEDNWVDKALSKLAKKISDMKDAKETRRRNKCFKEIEGKIGESGQCGESIKYAHDFLKINGVYDKNYVKPYYDRRKFIKKVDLILVSNIENSCKSRKSKGILKKCSKFTKELEENRAQCPLTSDKSKKTASFSFDKIFDFLFIKTAQAGSLDREKVRKDLIDGTHETARRYDTFSPGRNALMSIYKGASDKADVAYDQEIDMYGDNVEAFNDIQKGLNKYKASQFKLDYKIDDYSLESDLGDDKVRNINLTVSKSDENILGEIAHDLSKNGMAVKDFKNFLVNYKSSILTNSGSEYSKLSGELYKNAKSLSRALDKLPSPFSVRKKGDNPILMAHAKKQSDLVTESLKARLKKMDFNFKGEKLEELQGLAIKKSQENKKDDIVSNEEVNRDGDVSKNITTNKPPSDSKKAVSEDVGDGKITVNDIEVDKYGFSLDDNVHLDKEKQLKLLLKDKERREREERFGANNTTEQIRERDKHLFKEIIHPAYLKQYPQFIKVKK